MTSRDATEVPPGHRAGTEPEDEYAPVLAGDRLYPELWDVRNELTELAKQDD